MANTKTSTAITNKAEEFKLAQKAMEEFWPKILSDIVNDRAFIKVKTSMDRIKELLEYSVPDGKKFRY